MNKYSKRIGMCFIVVFTLIGTQKLSAVIGNPTGILTIIADGSKPNVDRYIDHEMAQKTANKKWDTRVMKDIIGADTVKKITAALNFTREGSEPRKLAVKKWDELSLIDIRESSTLAAALAATSESRSGGPTELAGFERIDSFCMKQVEKVKTLDDLIKTSVRSGSVPYKLLREKQIALSAQAMREAISMDQLWDAYNKSLEDDAAKNIAIESWDRIALKKTKNATTFVELLETFSNSRSSSEAQRLSILKAAKFLPDK